MSGSRARLRFNQDSSTGGAGGGGQLLWLLLHYHHTSRISMHATDVCIM